MFSNFTTAGKLIIVKYVLRKERLQSPTKCYTIWLEDAQGYAFARQDTLEINEQEHINIVLPYLEIFEITYMCKIYNTDGRLLWG